MADEKPDRLATIARTVEVVSVVIGIVISVLTFTAAQNQEASARIKEADARKLELQKYADERRDAAEKHRIENAQPFLKLRQDLYTETVKLAAILANPNDHTPAELDKAHKRYRQLYVAELSMVEGIGVEGGMSEFARIVDPSLANMTTSQTAAYELAHKLRDSLITSWRVDAVTVDNPNP